MQEQQQWDLEKVIREYEEIQELEKGLSTGSDEDKEDDAEGMNEKKEKLEEKKEREED